jgi:AbrB family looped-hinge helix DNA binding protein
MSGTATGIVRPNINHEEKRNMKATGIVRRVDDLGRIVIPKEIRRTLRIREGDPLLIILTSFDIFLHSIVSLAQRIAAA